MPKPRGASLGLAPAGLAAQHADLRDRHREGAEQGQVERREQPLDRELGLRVVGGDDVGRGEREVRQVIQHLVQPVPGPREAQAARAQQHCQRESTSVPSGLVWASSNMSSRMKQFSALGKG